MADGSGGAWVEVEEGARRVLPALPVVDVELGEIRWDRWERALVLTHIDPSCDTCGYGGPLACTRGKTLHQDPRRRTLVRRSRIAEGQRAVWGPVVVPEPRWVYSHWASRCQACDEMVVWLISGRGVRCTECGGVSPERLRDTSAQCPGCLRAAWHRVPRSGDARTWVEVAYHPPVTQRVPAAEGGVQGDTLF